MSDWKPSASLAVLRARAEAMRSLRMFFDARGLLEVTTPTLGARPVSDPALSNLQVPIGPNLVRYLQTSPEYHMKRLLAAGSGPIWQLGPVFRGDEAGRLHAPEFLMLEWYRPGWDHHALLQEVVDLVIELVGVRRLRRRSYADLFGTLGLDPHCDSVETLAQRAEASGLCLPAGLDRDALLDALFSHLLAPTLGHDGCIDAVDAFPASQAALARMEPGDPPVACRFEVFLNGMEIANGYHELCDPHEQARRFARDRTRRRALGKDDVQVDERLLAALVEGLPDCAGVALGFERLLMVRLGLADIADLQAFAWDRA